MFGAMNLMAGSISSPTEPCSSRRQRLQKLDGPALRRRHQFALPHYLRAPNDRANRPAGDGDAVIWCPAGFAGDPGVGDGLAATHVDDGEVGVEAGGDAAF